MRAQITVNLDFKHFDFLKNGCVVSVLIKRSNNIWLKNQTSAQLERTTFVGDSVFLRSPLFSLLSGLVATASFRLM